VHFVDRRVGEGKGKGKRDVLPGSLAHRESWAPLQPKLKREEGLNRTIRLSFIAEKVFLPLSWKKKRGERDYSVRLVKKEGRKKKKEGGPKNSRWRAPGPFLFL